MGPLPPPPRPDEIAASVQRIDRLLASGRPFVRSGCLTRGVTLYYFLRRGGPTSPSARQGEFRAASRGTAGSSARGSPWPSGATPVPSSPRPGGRSPASRAVFREAGSVGRSSVAERGTTLTACASAFPPESWGSGVRRAPLPSRGSLKTPAAPPPRIRAARPAPRTHSAGGGARTSTKPPVGEVVYADGSRLLYIRPDPPPGALRAGSGRRSLRGRREGKTSGSSPIPFLRSPMMGDAEAPRL